MFILPTFNMKEQETRLTLQELDNDDDDDDDDELVTGYFPENKATETCR